mgnify:CR=1 FL=1
MREAAHAYAARKDGVLEAYYPNLENVVLEAADAGLQAFNVYEAERVKEVAHKAKR